MVDRLKAYRSHSNLADFLLLAEKRPGMYFGANRLSDIRLVLGGWHLHRRFVEEPDPIADVMKGFAGFVEEFYGDNRTMGPFLMISEHTDDPKREYAEFMRLLREYLSRHPDLRDDPV